MLNLPSIAPTLIHLFGPSVVKVDPGAFALVGMAVFYGGLAHVPIASLVMVCELAGSYDLLVPLMFAEGIAFVLLRSRSIYHAQVGHAAGLTGASGRAALRRAEGDARGAT